MTHQSSMTKQHPSLLQVWLGLIPEHRDQVIRLMAQLALKLVVAQAHFLSKEVKNVGSTQHTQNSD